MTLLKAIILGLIQGATEFLPVSSSGHLVIMQHYLKTADAGLAFDVLLHLATVLAVLVYFRRDLVELLRRPKSIGLLIVGSIPAGLAGVLLEDVFSRLFTSVTFVAGALIVTGVILWLAEELSARVSRKKGFERISWGDALLVGVGQAVAITPGISRSGSTIATALALGIDREAAAKFSFLLSIPVILGAGLLQARNILGTGLGLSWTPLLGGFAAAFLAGLLAISVLLAVLRRHSLKVFSFYVWVLGAAVLLDRLF